MQSRCFFDAGFLPTDLSMDIMSADDGSCFPDVDDNDDVTGLYSKDRDPIVRTPPIGSPISRIARTVTSPVTGARLSRCSGRRKLWIAVLAIGIVLSIAIGIAVYFIVTG